MIDVSTKLSMMQERFKSSAEKEYAKALGDALNNVMAKIQNTQDDAMRRRLVVIRSLIEKEIGSITKQVIPFFQEDIQGFAELSHATMFKAMNASTGVGYAFAAMPASTIKEIINMDRVQLYGDKGFTMSELFSTEEQAQINRYKQIINAGLASNSGYAEIASRLKQANETGMKNIRSIVHTSISSARDIADAKVYESFDDVTTGWESNAVLDNRTSFLCASMDGVVYTKGKKDKFGTMITRYEDIKNRPPRHLNCRTKLLPRTMFSEGIDGTRSQNGDTKGQIDSKIKFPQWFEKQSTKFQRDYLGTARYDLYKSGKFTINSFVDVRDGTRFTLAELKGGVGDLVPSAKNKLIYTPPTDKDIADRVQSTIDNLQNKFKRPIKSLIFDVKMNGASARASVGGDIEVSDKLSRIQYVTSQHALLLSQRAKDGIAWTNPSIGLIEDALNHEYFHTLYMGNDFNMMDRAFDIAMRKYGVSYSDVLTNKDADTLRAKVYESLNIFKKEISKVKSAYSKDIKSHMKLLQSGSITREDYYNKIREISISEYANTNSDEFGAEAFSGYVGKKNPSKYEKMVGELVEKYLVFDEDL